MHHHKVYVKETKREGGGEGGRGKERERGGGGGEIERDRGGGRERERESERVSQLTGAYLAKETFQNHCY